MLPVTVTELPMAAIPGEIAKVSGVSPKAANANTAPDAISTKYAPGATSGTVRVVDIAPLPSEVTSEAPEQPAGDVLKQIVRAVLAAYPAPVTVMRVPTGPELGDRTRVGGSAVEPDGAKAIALLFASACPAPLEIRRTKIIAPVTGEPLTELRSPFNRICYPWEGRYDVSLIACIDKSSEVDGIGESSFSAA